jgi:hypothetical protein
MFVRAIIALVLCGFSLGANAALVGRAGGKAYYDDLLEITWLTDANYEQTSGYYASGRKPLWDIRSCINSLNSNNYLGANDWRLPSTGEPGSGAPCLGLDCIDGEMGSLFYLTLGNIAGGPLSNTGPFSNVQPSHYWSDTTCADFGGSFSCGYYFHFGSGTQNKLGFQYGTANSWAVLDGDPLTLVPIPATAYLFASALGLLGWARRGKR